MPLIAARAPPAGWFLGGGDRPREWWAALRRRRAPAAAAPWSMEATPTKKNRIFLESFFFLRRKKQVSRKARRQSLADLQELAPDSSKRQPAKTSIGLRRRPCVPRRHPSTCPSLGVDAHSHQEPPPPSPLADVRLAKDRHRLPERPQAIEDLGVERVLDHPHHRPVLLPRPRQQVGRVNRLLRVQPEFQNVQQHLHRFFVQARPD